MLVFPQGKGYIGITTRPLMQRIREHAMRKHKPSIVTLAIRKYGIHNVCVLVLTRGRFNRLKTEERKAIAFFNTAHPIGYNLTLGGDGVIPTELTRAKISAGNKGKIVSAESRARISAARIGLKMSKAFKARCAELCRERWSDPAYRARQVSLRIGKRSPEQSARMRGVLNPMKNPRNAARAEATLRKSLRRLEAIR